ncbi:MAG: secondary thiamine-phosphate synthase enzyme YjbQ [Chitinivibrionales bacterium]|nr:secondary thiamine-phosphate synthase enzyme YjbQ [Chitinivibrionales bacterium]
MVFFKQINIQTGERTHWIDIQSQVEAVVADSKIVSGICLVSSTHTTAGITINENADATVGRDVFWKLNQLVPCQDAYHHSEGNSDSHLKTSVVGLSVTVPVHHGKIIRGIWQAIYLCEFDGPRMRKINITVMGETAGP